MIIIINIILSLILSDRIDQINKLTKEAEEAFKNEDFTETIEKYELLIDSFDFSNEQVYLNLAHSHLLSKDTLKAIENYNYASLADKSEIKSIALQQLGNISEKNNKLEDALNFYKASIIADNKNNDSKYNYELVKKKLNNKKDQKQNNKNNQSQNEKNKDTSESKKNDNKGQDDKNNKKDKEEKKSENKENSSKSNEESVEEKLKKINMSKKKAEMILDALNNNEFQYIQQLKRKSKKKLDKNKPDW
tara:strand:- start:605 stop:1348 length:744 start_codon:yes stop_codon:yes gene_type:complete